MTGVQTCALPIFDGGDYLAVNQVAVIDKGTNDGLQQGSMFALKEKGYAVKGDKGEYHYDDENNKKSIQLPETVVGELIVIRPYESFSLALITRSETPIHKRMIVTSPQTK